MANRILQVAGVSACILMAPQAVHSLKATPPVVDDAGVRVLGM